MTLVDPEAVGMNAKMLQGYESTMQQLVRRGTIPGCASVVLRQGQVVQAGCWGYADVERKTPFRLDTLCRLYCATKSYVVTAFMTLVDEGRVSLEDPLERYLPCFSSPRVLPEGATKAVKASVPIRLKHLVSHMSGIGYAPELGCEAEGDVQACYLKLQQAIEQGRVRSLKDFVHKLAKVPLARQPGTQYEYGYSVDVLGRVLEVVMGKNLKECLRQRLFIPLGMDDTMWAVPDSELPRFAALYAGPETWGNLYGGDKKAVPITPKSGMLRIDGNRIEDSKWRAGNTTGLLSGGGFMGYKMGGLVSTVADTVKFVRMLQRRGLMDNGQRLLRESTLTMMEKNRNKASWGQGSACYLGNIGVFREGKEYGMGGAACTYWSVDHADKTACIWFTQHIDMPEVADMTGIDKTKADLWKAVHKSVVMGGKKGSAGSAQKRKLSKAPSSASAPRKRARLAAA